MTGRTGSARLVRQTSHRAAALALAIVLAACRNAAGPLAPAVDVVVPDVSREFRGLWIATVANIDWPSRAGLSAAGQQVELNEILDLAASTGINAVILQIRPAGDALYRSSLEPWSKSLTGLQGGDPGYDPLAYAIEQAHARGLELHAWFNPFRAGNVSDTASFSPVHLSRSRPDLRRVVGSQVWFDPGEPEVRDHAIAVITDVVRRYDVDGVHLDDFFYPYPAAGAPRPVTFPDSTTYARYLTTAGPQPLPIADWRRDNINRFVERFHREVKLVKPAVRVGISPFGIWRPGNPAGVTGLDAWADIFADSRLWLQRGWVDYLAPQLYWPVSSPGQSFPMLFNWWNGQNTMRRHIWPGLAAYRVADGTSSAYTSAEIAQQLGITRTASSPGALLFNTTVLRLNRGGLADMLRSGPYAAFALTPSFPWIDSQAPPGPTGVIVRRAGGTVRMSWDGGPAAADRRWWLVRYRAGGVWFSRLVPADRLSFDLPPAQSTRTDAAAVAAVDAAGNLGSAVLWR